MTVDRQEKSASARAPGIVLPGPVLIVGCGKMGGALLRGWLGRGVSARQIAAVDPAFATGVAGFEDIAAASVALLGAPDQLPPDFRPALVLLAVKPQFMDAALPGYRRLVSPDTVFLSIAAGKSLAYFHSVLGDQARIVRSMPNTPAAIGKGMTVIYRDPAISAEQLALCGELLAAVGTIAWIDREDLLDAVTAVSGGGPAYVFLLIECLARAGCAAGLPEDLAAELARLTVCGAGALAEQSQEDVVQLRQNVTSPKGTTLEALKVLMAPDGLQDLMTRAVAAAARRSRELSR